MHRPIYSDFKIKLQARDFREAFQVLLVSGADNIYPVGEIHILTRARFFKAGKRSPRINS